MDRAWRDIHRWIASKPFDWKAPPDCFLDEEVSYLNQYGSWLEALAFRWLVPMTDAQRRFVRVANNERDPESFALCEPANFAEFLWAKYIHEVSLMPTEDELWADQPSEEDLRQEMLAELEDFRLEEDLMQIEAREQEEIEEDMIASGDEMRFAMENGVLPDGDDPADRLTELSDEDVDECDEREESEEEN